MGWEREAGHWLSTTWIFTVAWIAGTLSFGAPAGAGVREAILTWQLTPLLGPTHAAAAAVALRVITTAGDLLASALGRFMAGDEAPAADP